MPAHPEMWLIRHGETEWSRSGQHTGRTDLALTPEGERQATAIGRCLGGKRFDLVLTSPLQRARRTAELGGLGDAAQIEPNLREWDYGAYEGLTSAEIQKQVPGWTIWTHPVPEGEAIGQVVERARQVIERAATAGGTVALFSHGHFLRVLTACWLRLPPENGKLFALGTASISVLGYERETRVIQQWNTLCNC